MAVLNTGARIPVQPAAAQAECPVLIAEAMEFSNIMMKSGDAGISGIKVRTYDKTGSQKAP